MTSQRDLLRLLASVESTNISRRELVKRGSALGLGAYALGAVGPQLFQARAQDNAGTPGGNLTVALVGEPPTLDEHQTTAGVTAEVTSPVYETLFAYDNEFQPIPMLADTYTISEDGLTQTITLRQGVPFHNGEVMTAADVKASLDRWGQISGVGKNLYAKITSVDATDDHTITLNLTEPYGTVAIALSNNTQACSIYPKSVIDAGTLEPNETCIGTGPYRLADRRADAYIRLERFDDYAALEGGPNGYGGTKYAYADTIEFIPVTDIAARVAGLQAGDYLMHMTSAMSNDQYDVVVDYPGLVTTINTPTEWPVFFLNWQSPVMSNLALREAVQATLDMEPMLQAAYGTADFYQLDPGLMMKQTAWYTTAGEDRYNMADPELGRQKLEEAGYDGTPVRFMSTQEYGYMYATSTVAVQQLEAIGMVIDHQVIDWATVVERRAQPEEWDMFVTGHGFVPDPSQISYVGQMNIYPGWWDSEDSLELAAQMLAAGTFEERFPIWEQIQANAYTQIPAIKIGDGATLTVLSDQVKGMDAQFERGYKYWNLWIEG
ncbi:MAG: ABC transporter substrate-binding protein [Thermomicrobiales bacterium]|nr:ABC transporter substrate-binding protein [Thermomicrobiales bacterium]MCO5221413.1 ABC transporter substrate-binding protein [Thermomicrobiales bacterium]